jgi:two-component system response regulator AtoC
MSPQGRILVAEDDPRARESLTALLAEEGYQVEAVSDGNAASRALSADDFDAALLDVRMPGKDGLAVLRELGTRERPPAVLVMTAYGTSSVAIEAMKLGAYDYITKPLHFDELLIQLERAVANRRQSIELETYRGDEQRAAGEAEIVGNSLPMQQVYKLIGQVAPTGSTVLVRGESGTGKELIARAIHAHSPRKQSRLVCVNCAAIPDALLEAELFGHEKGAFTGAVALRRGRFELAHGGTIFLDEIGELSAAMQAKLLRALQEKTIERLGSEQSIQLDVRIIAATNRDLEQCVKDGSFREDLYYRLNVVTIRVPPLRERPEDIPELADHLLSKLARQHKLHSAGLTPDAEQGLRTRAWPGNVRELEHTLERALVLSRGAPIGVEHLTPDARTNTADPLAELPLDEGMHALVSRLERRLIERALEESEGNRTRAAEKLKINRRLLYDKLREYGIE